MKKNKIFILLVLMLSMVIFSSKYVNAYSGDIDPEDYITFPIYPITTTNTFGLDVASSKLKEKTSYTLYQQEIEISDELLQQIKSATSNSERISLIPDYNDAKWKKISDTKAEIDVSAFSGEKSILLWIKLEIDGNTYYDFNIYILNGTKKTNNQTAVNSITITDGKGESFSNGNFATNAYLKIDGINFNSGKNYYVAVAHTKSEPTYDNTKFAVLDPNTKLANISECLEENGDLYVWLYEEDSTSNESHEHTTLVDGQKVNRPEYPSYGNRIIYAGLGNGFTTNIPRRKTGMTELKERKINVKIGKVEDTNILNKIKNKDVTGMADLLSYAKNSSAIIENTVNSTSNYPAGNKIDLSSLNAEKGAYYYAYFVMDDENGTYYPIEDINLLYSAGNNILYNQTEDGFKWELAETSDTKASEETKKDDTVSPSKLAQAGEKAGVIIVISIVGISAVVYYIKSKKLY